VNLIVGLPDHNPIEKPRPPVIFVPQAKELLAHCKQIPIMRHHHHQAALNAVEVVVGNRDLFHRRGATRFQEGGRQVTIKPLPYEPVAKVSCHVERSIDIEQVRTAKAPVAARHGKHCTCIASAVCDRLSSLATTVHW
jgi:hypothetical protein